MHTIVIEYIGSESNYTSTKDSTSTKKRIDLLDILYRDKYEILDYNEIDGIYLVEVNENMYHTNECLGLKSKKILLYKE